MDEIYKYLLSIIIVNYNGEKFLVDCITSIHKYCQSFDYEIIIVDNNSSDSSLKLIENDFKEIVLIKNKTNIGFAAGNNIGANFAQGKYLLVLNNDTVLLNNLKPAIVVLENDYSIGVVGIKMLDREKIYRQSSGYFPSILRLLKLKTMMINSKGFENGDFEESQNIFIVDWIEGSFLFTSRSLWKRINGMDETFFMYAEDIDFCKRLNSIGKKTVYLPKLSYIHFGGFNNKRNKQLKKGLIKYVTKHFTGIKKVLGLINIEVNFFVKEYVKKSV